MKRNEAAQSLVLHYGCSYNHFIRGNYNAALSCHLYREYKDYKNLSYPFILKGDLKQKGTQFMLRRPDLGVLMFYETVEVLITDYFSRFKYQIYKTIPETFKYAHIVEVRYINEDQCDIRSSLVYDNKIFLSEKEFQDVIRFKLNVFKSIELSLRKFIIPKLSLVYTVINSKIELIWNILKNLKMIHKYCLLLDDQINYNGNVLKKDDIIELTKIRGYNKIKSIAKVNKIKMNRMNLTKDCIIELLFQKVEKYKYPFANTKIIFRIYEFEGKCSMYIIYFFLNNQTSPDLDNFTRKKNKELRIFKDIVENYNENNKNTQI